MTSFLAKMKSWPEKIKLNIDMATKDQSKKLTVPKRSTDWSKYLYVRRKNGMPPSQCATSTTDAKEKRMTKFATRFLTVTHLHTETHPHTHTNTHTQTHIHTQTCRTTHTHTQTQTHRHKQTTTIGSGAGNQNQVWCRKPKSGLKYCRWRKEFLRR